MTEAEMEFEALRAVCAAEQQAADLRLARHLRGECPFAEQDLACQCHGRTPGSLAAFKAASYKGWAIPSPSPEGRMPTPPEEVLEGVEEADGSRLRLSLSEYQARQRLLHKRRR